MTNGLPTYLSVILYELFYHKHLSQKELVEQSGIPKQSINKGIKLLQEKNYLAFRDVKGDRRVKECYLTMDWQL
ncbi:MarR family transcriptional regulator [Lactobacillus psittaci]|nr:helix-turn-helix domain-containing protein [Lactobacillus psittaci]